MCCFSAGAVPGGLLRSVIGGIARIVRPPVRVSATNIFARMAEPGIQLLAYGMNLKSDRELAMVLPLPVAAKSGEHAVTFIDLAKYPGLFERLRELFEPAAVAAFRGGAQSLPKSRSRLVVHRVGSFIASYVPTRADFTRLDPRFRLPEVLFDAVPHYADYGFAVFQLHSGNQTVHPMALRFPTRDARLFFPTVHVHDGRFHPHARFDHTLYYQAAASSDGDELSSLPSATDYDGLLAHHPMARRLLRGRLDNRDTWIAA